MHTRPERAAVIAIGSNSTRLLCADLDGKLSNPIRGREETKLLLALAGDQQAEALPRLIEAVKILKQQALDAGAQHLRLTATAAVRDSGHQQAFAEAVFKEAGLVLQVLSGQEEAECSFLGAAYPYTGDLGVIDIGGGSTEIALGDPSGISWATSLQLGASRLYNLSPVHSALDLVPALAQAERVLDAGLEEPETLPSRWLLVGGTGTALIGLLQGQMMDASQTEDVFFTARQAVDMLNQLAHLSPQERAQLPGMTPGREHILPTGLVILRALMTRLSIQEMAVTQRNNCDGYLWALQA